MPIKCCVAMIVLTAITHGGFASEQEPFRRVLLEATVPIGEEAPPVAVQGNLVAFGAGHEIKVFDTRRQEMIMTLSLVPGATSPSLAYEARPLGIFGTTVYAYVRHFADPDRLAPGGKAGAVRCGGGGDPGEFEVVAVRVGEKDIRSVAHLASDVTLAEGLLNKGLPFVKENSLSLLSLETGAIRTMTLPGPAVNRPVVRDGELVGRYEGGVYWLTTNEASPRVLSFANTPLARLAERDAFAKCGDLLVGLVEDHVVACGLDGRLRWRTPIIAGVVIGSRKHVLVLRQGWDWPTLCSLNQQNGALSWRAPVSPRIDRLQGMEVFGRRIVFFNEGEISVFDCATGQLLVNLPQKRNLVRRSHSIFATLVRMAISGDVLAIGFENMVFAIDLTPTSDVAEKCWTDDPANARREVDALAKTDPKENVSVQALAEIGHNMADTPEMAPAIIPLLRSALSRCSDDSLDVLVRAFHWLDDDAVRDAAVRVLGSNIHEVKRICITDILACHPVAEKGLAVLRKVAAGGDAYSVAVRGEAAKWLRLTDKKSTMNPADLAQLYSGDHDAAVAAFARRLRETEAGGRTELMKLIGMAADQVIVALADDLGRLPEGEREEGMRLVAAARTRVAAIARTSEQK